MKKGLLTKALSLLTAVCILAGSADLSVFAMETGVGESAQVEGKSKSTAEEEPGDDLGAVKMNSMGVMGAAALSADAEEAAYAILYSDGALVFQRGNTPDSSHGSVVNTYTRFETDVYKKSYDVPWSSKRDSIKSVIVKDSIKPISTRYWFYSCGSCVSMDLALLDTSLVTDMSNMFANCSKLV